MGSCSQTDAEQIHPRDIAKDAMRVMVWRSAVALKMLHLKWLVTTVLASAISAGPVLARVAPITLEELFWQSDIVVVGRDVRTFEVDSWKIAEFQIIRVLRGTPNPATVFYLAEPTWTCDISTATSGEESLLFLTAIDELPPDAIAGAFVDPVVGKQIPIPRSIDGRPMYLISHSGRGRMPIGKSHGVDSLRLMLVDVKLPESLREMATEVSEYEIQGSVPLHAMEDILRALPIEAPSPTPGPTFGPLPPDKLRP